MATAYTTYATSQLAARTDLSQAPNLKKTGGKIYHLDVSITGYTGATSTPLFLARLPAGARLIAHHCSVDVSSGSGLTGKLGYYTADTDTPAIVDDACFVTGLALTSAGHVALTAGTVGSALLTPFSFSTDVWIVATWTTASSPGSHSQTWHLTYTLA